MAMRICGQIEEFITKLCVCLRSVSLRLIEGEEAKIVSDSLDGLGQDDVVTVLKITGDDVEVEDSTKENHTVKKSDLEQNKKLHSKVLMATSYH